MVAAVVALQGVIDRGQIGGRARERADVVETGDKLVSAAPRQPPVGRLDAEDAAQRRRHADRAVGIGAQAHRHHARGHRRARTAGGAAGDARQVMRIARCAVVGVFSGEAEGVLVHVERAQQHRAGAAQARYQGSIVGRRRAGAVDFRAGQGGEAGDVEKVLGRIGHAGQRRQVAAGRARGVDGACFGQCARLRQLGERMDFAVERGDRRQRRPAPASAAERLPSRTAPAISSAPIALIFRASIAAPVRPPG